MQRDLLAGQEVGRDGLGQQGVAERDLAALDREHVVGHGLPERRVEHLVGGRADQGCARRPQPTEGEDAEVLPDDGS